MQPFPKASTMKIAGPRYRIVVCFLAITTLALYLMRSHFVRINETVPTQEEFSVYIEKYVRNKMSIKSKPALPDLHNVENNSLRFLYLMQSEKCLHSHLILAHLHVSVMWLY